MPETGGDKDEIGNATWITFAKEWLKLGDEAEQSTGGHGASQPERRLGPGMSAAWKSVAGQAGLRGLGIRGTPWLLLGIALQSWRSVPGGAPLKTPTDRWAFEVW